MMNEVDVVVGNHQAALLRRRLWVLPLSTLAEDRAVVKRQIVLSIAVLTLEISEIQLIKLF